MGLSGQNGGSRCATPLSRQNSMSMEDFTTSMPALGQNGQARDRVTSSARFRRSNPGSPRKSVSIDSLHQHQQTAPSYYDGNFQQNEVPSRQSSAGSVHHYHNHPQNGQQQNRPEYTLDTYLPATSTAGNGYYNQEPPRSNPGSPSKRVAFKGLPNNYNHPVAPYNTFDVANPRMDTPMMMTQDDMLAIEQDPNTQHRVSYPALMNGINNVTSSAMTPYNMNRVPVPVTSAQSNTKALVSPNNHVMTNNYPQLDYNQHLMQNKYGQLIQNPGQYAIDQHNLQGIQQGKKNSLPAIMAPNTGAVQPYLQQNLAPSDTEDENEGQKLELEYKGNENQVAAKQAENNRKNSEDTTNKLQQNNTDKNTSQNTNNGVIKVAMVADISMSNFHQCK